MSTSDDRSNTIHIRNARTIVYNPPVPRLIEASLSRSEASLVSSGALCAETGDRTGRSPNDKFFSDDPEFREEIWWGEVNRAVEPSVFMALLGRIEAYLQGREVFVFDGFAGADAEYRLPVRIVTERAWHSLFARQLFIRPNADELESHRPEFTVVSVPGFKADPARDGVRSEVFVLLSLERRLALIGGTEYAGEIKKSIFTVMNYLMPKRGVAAMHCSANVGSDGDTALFFGLSGTGKTTLSADPDRGLIGDDEHGWSDRGVFNFEGGCYAKCIRLSKRREPQIWNAIKYGSVLENVVFDPESRQVDYDLDEKTENTRAAYPVDFIENAVIPGVGGHPKTVIFLTADAFGVLPPISRLTPAQTMYHFISGYTSKLAGTETGVTEPQTTFSACFGAPFMPLHPQVYAKLLAERIRRHNSRVYLVNTGWTGGPYGTGDRIRLSYTRSMVRAALKGQLESVECVSHPIFGVEVPTSCPDVPSHVLDPRATWDDPRKYDIKARELAQGFIKNIAKFPEVSEEILAAGPRV